MKEKNKKKEKKGRAVFISIIIVLSAGLIAAAGIGFMRVSGGPGGPGVESSAGGEAESEVIFAVNTTPAVLGPITDYFAINGEVVSAGSVDIYADASGILARLYVQLGDYVRENQIIAEVDPSRPGLTYALSPVKTRVSGTVTALRADQGDSVRTAATPIATIGDLNRLQVITAIPERFISRIRAGMPAEVTLEAWPGRVIPLQVDSISPVVDPASRTMKIEMNIPPGISRAKPGMYAEVRLTTDDKNQVVKIPADSILRRLGEVFVYVIEDGRALKRNVVPGITLEGAVEIVKGLEAGEIVAYQGQTLLEDGVKVRVVRSIEGIL